ncbi:MAG: nucleotide exchange factor GrpE, partial [Gemmatimonadetes bacterium]|nr:nucleotide exchange factor GrpE [Gemmatimonadota bacterium]
VQMIYDKFQHALESLGIEAFSAIGQMFDPNSMEALTTLSVPGKPENEVVGEIRKGYRYRGELLRTAQVMVNQPAAEEPAESK